MSVHDNSEESFHTQKESGSAVSYRMGIFQTLTTRGAPMTDRELMEELGATDPNYVRPEVTRLKQLGVIREAGNTTCPITKRKVRLVELTGKPFDATNPPTTTRPQPVGAEGLKVRWQRY